MAFHQNLHCLKKYAQRSHCVYKGLAGIIFSRISSESPGGILNIFVVELSLSVSLSLSLCLSLSLSVFVINVEKYPSCYIPWADPEGGQGVWTPPPPPEKSQIIRIFLAILVRIPWKIQKLQSQNSMLGHHRHASEFRWRADGGLLYPPFPHKLKKNFVKLDPL